MSNVIPIEKTKTEPKQKTLTELVIDFCHHIQSSERSRLKAGRVLLEMKRRVEAVRFALPSHGGNGLLCT
jgi:hypothetical protein